MSPVEIIQALNTVTPLAIIALLVWIVYLLVAKKGPLRQLGTNHLHDLPNIAVTLRELLTEVRESKQVLGELRDGINFLKGKLD